MTKAFYEGRSLNKFGKAATLSITDGTTQDVAKAVAFLASDNAKWMTGSAMPVDGGFMSQ